MLLVGLPGSGKTTLATRFASLLPPKSDEEAPESAAVRSLAGSFNMAHWKVRRSRSPITAPRVQCWWAAAVNST